MSESLEHRVDRLESIAAITQLPIRYALAVDGRDLDAWVSLFIEDVNCGRAGQGREVLRSIITPQLKTFYRSIHQICGHKIELDGPDNATGTVYCRAEHEDQGKWIIMAIAYFDTYERRNGQWFFSRRQEKHWYEADWEKRPKAPFTEWHDHEVPPRLPQEFSHWNDFWVGEESALINRMTALPTGEKHD